MSRVIHHHTSLEGFKSIIESRSVWLSDVRYLNDYTEITEGKKWIEHLIDGDIFEETFGLINCRDQIMAELVDFINEETTCFAACFCANSDQLSQWRGYSQHSFGCSIGFNSDLLVQSGARLKQIEYASDAIIRNIEQSIKRAVAKIRTERASSSNILASLNAMRVSLADICMTAKSKAFEEEAEYRLFLDVESVQADKVKYRVKGPLLIPYISLDLHDRWSEAIEEVWTAPNSDKNTIWRSVKEFLSYHGLGGVELKTSAAPYRT